MSDLAKIETMLVVGEGDHIEFKRAGDGPKADTYESICAFLNHTGGELLLGVGDKGELIGLPEKAVDDMMRSIVKITNDPNQFRPACAVWPEHVVYRGCHLIHVHVAESPTVHWYKGDCYERVHEADVLVKGSERIAQMYIRKQRIFTEQRVYSTITKEDLRLDLLSRIRNMARTRSETHPWIGMSDDELLASAQLTGRDYESGKDGFKVAAVLLLGKDNVIGDLFPAYKTDAIMRRVNVDRYDDRDIVCTNLVESWDRLVAFGMKHLNDKFYLDEKGQSVSLLGRILREVVSNLLIHREFTSAMPGRLIIERDRLVADNANKAYYYGQITLSNLKPQTKNPIIASFFRNICRADELGSGVRNLYRDVKLYSSAEPVFDEGDVFTLTIPLNDDVPAVGQRATPQVTPQVPPQVTPQVGVDRLLGALEDGERSSSEVLVSLGLHDRKAMQERYVIPALDAGLIERTQPNPHAPNQKYRLTEKGRAALAAIKTKNGNE